MEKLRQRRGRQTQGRTLIDGRRELELARAAGIRLLEIFWCPELFRAPDLIGELIGERELAVTEVSRGVFQKIAYGERAEGILAVAQTPSQTLAGLKLPHCPLVAVLEGIEKPGNLGAMLRSADAAGVSAVVLADPLTDLYNPNVIRASLGTVFQVPVAVASAEETLTWLRASGLAIFAAVPGAACLLWEQDFSGPAALVLGAEAQGLSPVWLRANINTVALPMLGTADSLNVSATAAVLFYEALRQRQIAAGK